MRDIKAETITVEIAKMLGVIQQDEYGNESWPVNSIHDEEMETITLKYF